MRERRARTGATVDKEKTNGEREIEKVARVGWPRNERRGSKKTGEKGK